jgi:flagellin-specific chaperone FliS
MLLEGAVKVAMELQEAHRQRDFESIDAHGSKCRSILVALMSELDASVDRRLAEMLTSLHSWLWQQVASAQCPEDLDLAIELMEQQRDAWREAIDLMRAVKDDSAAGPLDVAG